MNYLTAVGITVGILAGIWCYAADAFRLVSFVGFLGWATYFAAGGGKAGVKLGLCSNISGVFWGLLTTFICSFFPDIPYYFFTILFAAIMCWQARFSLLSFIPGTFIGNAAYYAASALANTAGADPFSIAGWTALGLFCGIGLGLISDNGAKRLCPKEEQ